MVHYIPVPSMAITGYLGLLKWPKLMELFLLCWFCDNLYYILSCSQIHIYLEPLYAK